MPLTIAVGGLLHETNTFVAPTTPFADFERQGAWPGFVRGEAMLARIAPYNIAAAGFIDVATAAGHRIAPLSWCMAQPSGHVADGAFERVGAFLLADIAEAAPDVVFLELHGAMCSQTLDDAEGELLRRVRALVGPDIPILASLDLHANVTQAMVDHASFLSAYRTYPHVDWLETGRRCARWLDAAIAWGPRPARAFRQIPFLIPIAAGCSLIEPMKGLYALLEEIERETGVHLSLCPGFPSADIHDCGATVVGYGATQDAVDRAVDRLASAVLRAEGAFAAHRALPLEEALDRAVAASRGRDWPVIVADTQDNPGGGGSSATTGFLRALVARGGRALSALHHEPTIAQRAHEAGAGGTLAVTFGTGAEGPGQEPFAAMAAVVALSDGRFLGTGPMVGGQPIAMGPSAWLRIGAVDVIVNSVRQQPHCVAVATHLGVQIEDYPVIVLKSSVHFRGDWQPRAAEVIVGAAPGALVDDTGAIPYQRLRPGVRRRPLANAS